MLERNTLSNIETPEGTDSWVPIPHIELLERTDALLREVGFLIKDEAHAVANHGLNYFGLMTLTGADGMSPFRGQSAKELDLLVGLRNSHSKQFRAGMVAGTHVFVCDNMAFMGEIKVARKHTTNVRRDLNGLLYNAVGRIMNATRTMEERLEAYKATPLTEALAESLILRAATDWNVCGITRTPHILQEWREPSYAEFEDSNKTLWRLENAFTTALKPKRETALLTIPERTMNLHVELDKVAGLVGKINDLLNEEERVEEYGGGGLAVWTEAQEEV